MTEMPDTKEGREAQARQAEKRQRRREIAKALAAREESERWGEEYEMEDAEAELADHS